MNLKDDVDKLREEIFNSKQEITKTIGRILNEYSERTNILVTRVRNVYEDNYKEGKRCPINYKVRLVIEVEKEEIFTSKREDEKIINKILAEYSIKTGLLVEDISFECERVHNTNKNDYFSYQIKLKVEGE